MASKSGKYSVGDKQKPGTSVHHSFGSTTKASSQKWRHGSPPTGTTTTGAPGKGTPRNKHQKEIPKVHQGRGGERVEDPTKGQRGVPHTMPRVDENPPQKKTKGPAASKDNYPLYAKPFEDLGLKWDGSKLKGEIEGQNTTLYVLTEDSYQQLVSKAEGTEATRDPARNMTQEPEPMEVDDPEVQARHAEMYQSQDQFSVQQSYAANHGKHQRPEVTGVTDAGCGRGQLSSGARYEAGEEIAGHRHRFPQSKTGAKTEDQQQSNGEERSSQHYYQGPSDHHHEGKDDLRPRPTGLTATRHEIVDRQTSRDFHDCRDKFTFISRNCGKVQGAGVTIYQANLKTTYHDKDNGIKKVEFGKKNKSMPEKVVMLVGGTGTGKSTMINALLNYISGIEWQDQYRLKLVQEAISGKRVNQANSQTDMITAYTIHHQPWSTVPYTLTIIDTPGFGDTGGIKRDEKIMEQIRTFFMTQGSGGIDHLDAVGFVVQAALPRLTKIQRYVFENILSIFGRDIAQNIFMLLTFADGQKPQVLSGLKEANMQYQNFYKFNNSALFICGKEEEEYGATEEESEDDSDEDDGGADDNYFNKMFWKMGAGNFTKFITDLGKVEAQSLVLTAEVLEERYMLEMTTNSIQEKIKIGLKKLEQLKTEQKLLKRHESDLEENKNFKYDIDEAHLVIVSLPQGHRSVNCTHCHFSCHKECTRMFIKFCRAINVWGYCRYCPQRCSSAKHEFQTFNYEVKMVKVTKTSEELKRRYEEAAGKKLTTQQLIAKSNDEFEEVQAATLELTEQARKCLARLSEIALKPNPLSTTDYIDLMIQEEEFMRDPGWRETVAQLEEVKKRASNITQIAMGSYDPFGNAKGKGQEPGNLDVVARMYKNMKRVTKEKV